VLEQEATGCCVIKGQESSVAGTEGMFLRLGKASRLSRVCLSEQVWVLAYKL